MPANLTPDYLAAERAFREAQSAGEKIAALEQMLATLPKHKGTEKLQADLRRRLSEARKESQKKGGPHGVPPWLVRREGAGQVVLLGPPNSGKSSLVGALTHAHPSVGDYPFTTHLPTAGMMPFEDVQIQMVDLPAIAPEFTESWLPQVIRAASLGLLVVDPGDLDVLAGTEYIINRLEQWRCSRPAIVVGNKLDLPQAAENFAALEEILGPKFTYIGVSALTGTGLQDLARAVFKGLGVVRFYSKPPGRKPDMEVPYVLRCGATVQDAAACVHRDVAGHLRMARLYQPGDPHGQAVERSHVVEDGDILEFHA